MTSDPDTYRQARSWAISQPGTIKPADLQRPPWSLSWSQACSLLEELEHDRVITRTGGFGKLEWRA